MATQPLAKTSIQELHFHSLKGISFISLELMQKEKLSSSFLL